MNTLEQIKSEQFINEQFIKGRILDDTKDYGRTQFVDEIYTLQQENKQLKEKNEDLEFNWEIIRQYCLDEQIPEESDEYNSYIEFSNSVYDNILNKMQELEQGSDSNE